MTTAEAKKHNYELLKKQILSGNFESEKMSAKIYRFKQCGMITHKHAYELMFMF